MLGAGRDENLASLGILRQFKPFSPLVQDHNTESQEGGRGTEVKAGLLTLTCQVVCRQEAAVVR